MRNPVPARRPAVATQSRAEAGTVLDGNQTIDIPVQAMTAPGAVASLGAAADRIARDSAR